MTRGVKQGDPLSPLLFNMIIDELLDLLPDQIGAKIYGARFNALGFSDDLILISNDEKCARERLSIKITFFEERTMRINVKKCFSLNLEMSRKDRSPTCVTTPRFSIDDQQITPTTRRISLSIMVYFWSIRETGSNI